MPSPKRQLDVCPNCQVPFTGKHCAECGGSRFDYRTSLGVLIRDFASDYLNLDSRLLRTVGALLFRPGFLTREYIDGRRERYIKPLRLYLVISVAALLVLSYRLSAATQEWSDEERVGRIAAAFDSTAFDSGAVYVALVDSMGDAVFRSDVRRALDEAERVAHGDTAETRSAADAIGFSIGTLMSDPAVRATMLQDLVQTIPRMMFVLMPLFAVALKLFYIRRKRLYVEHLVFALHVHAFLFLYITVAALVPLLFAVVWLVALVYTFLAMKRAYGQGWFKTLVKTLLSLWVYTLMMIFVFSAGITVYGLFVAAQAEGLSVWRLISG